MERQRIVTKDTITKEIITYISDMVTLNYLKQNSGITREDYEYEMERLRDKRDSLICSHASRFLPSALLGLKVQTLTMMEQERRLSDSFAHRYLNKTGFLSAIDSNCGDVEGENRNF